MKSSAARKSSFSPIAVVEAPGARADAAEVEAQHGAADPRQRLRRLIDHLGVHRAAELRMRMREDDRRAETVGLAALDQPLRVDAAIRRRLVEQRLEWTGRTGDLTQASRRPPSG